jgi:hypothetical protein
MRVVFVLLILFEALNISSQTKQSKSLFTEIVDQIILSDNLQSNIFNGNYNSSDVRNVLKDNRVSYKTFYINLRSSVNEDFSNTVNYAYSRANFLFDEDEEVIYWLSEYSTYLRGLKNRISNDYSQPNYLAKNNSKANSKRNKTNTKKNSLNPIVKKVTPIKEILEESISKETITVSSIGSLEKIKEQPVAKERSSNISNEIQETKTEETTINNSIESIDEVVPELINKTKEVKDPINIESQKNNAIESQKTTIEDTQAEKSTEIVEEIIQEPSEENSIKIQETTIEETTINSSIESIEEVVPEVINKTIKEVENSIITESSENNTIEHQETRKENSIELQKTTIENTQAENSIEIVEEIVQETSKQNSIETQETIIEKTKSEKTNEIPEKIIQESNAIVTPKENSPKEEQPIKTNESIFQLSYSAKLENELANKAVLYYTVRVKSVSNPTDGLKFLMEIKDNDAVWDEHTFHLFKDQENKNITNISIGKFVDKENAEELMAYLKTKNIKNPSIEIHENNVESTDRNVLPKSKPLNTTKPRTTIENPVNKAVKSPEVKKEVFSNKNLLDNISTKVDESENYFSVQVGANNKISSTNIQGLNLNKEKLFFVNIEKGKYAMNYGKHEDYGAAHKIALEIHKKGLETAFVTKYENGVRVKISKSDYLTDKTPKKTISDDINQLGYIPIGPNDKGKFVQIGTIYNWDAHNFKSLYDQLERTIYYKIKENNSVIFLVGPLQENEVFIELRNVRQVISDAFIKTI